MLRFLSAGESHGQALVITIDGMPAGLEIDIDDLNRQLRRRQGGYGRGRRMQIESDRAEILAGVRKGRTTGAPIAMLIRNRDWVNWQQTMHVEHDMPEGASGTKRPEVTRPRPGHADLAGALKYNFHDARYILERASARETTSRVAVGALAKAYLAEFGIGVLSHVIAVGDARLERQASWEELVALSQRDEVLLGCVDAEAEQRMKAVVDEVYKTGDTVGGVFEVVAHGVPPGLGSHIAWDTRLDGKLAQAIVSMQAVKGVEVGFAAEGAAAFGSKVQDTIQYSRDKQEFTRGANRAGGLEGGMTNGQDILVRGMLKPISTLRRPLESADLKTHEPALAAYERSDVAVVPAAGVIGEAMVAIVLAQAFLEKFGGDSLEEIQTAFRAERSRLIARLRSNSPEPA